MRVKKIFPKVSGIGLGPTVSLEGTRCIGDRGFYVVGNARAATLFGEFFLGGVTIDDDLTAILENQLGIGWKRELGRVDLNIRALWESQIWLNPMLAGAGGTNWGFTGPTLGVEARF